MDRIEYFKDMKIKLQNNEITGDDAINMINDAIKKKSWHLKEWKEKRKKIIGKYCEKCGSDGIMVLQHSVHPKIKSHWNNFIIDKFLNAPIDKLIYVDKTEITSKVIENSTLRLCCPKCYSVNIQERKHSRPKYICRRRFKVGYSKNTGYLVYRECQNQFDEASNILFYLDGKTTSIDDAIEFRLSKERSAKKTEIVGRMLSKHQDEIKKYQAIDYCNQNIDYLSLSSNVRTLCKKCAWIEDKHMIYKHIKLK